MPGVLLRRSPSPPSQNTKPKVKQSPMAERVKTIWCSGYPPDNHLMSKSFTEIASTPRQMSTIPRAGLSRRSFMSCPYGRGLPPSCQKAT